MLLNSSLCLPVKKREDQKEEKGAIENTKEEEDENNAVPEGKAKSFDLRC